MSNFSDFIKDNSNQKNDISNSDKQYTESDLENMINKYGEYGEDKLLDEFVKLTINKKKKGELSEKEMLKVKNTLTPFLNEDQISKLNRLIEMVRDVR